jgi:hypothetical protein
MIRHIVAFRLASTDPTQRTLDARGIHNHLTALVGVVPTVRSIEVGQDLGFVHGHWDVVLVSVHDSNADLEAYQVHPEHVRAAAWVATVVNDRATVDYEF